MHYHDYPNNFITVFLRACYVNAFERLSTFLDLTPVHNAGIELNNVAWN